MGCVTSSDDEPKKVRNTGGSKGGQQTAGEPDPWSSIYYQTPGMTQPVGLNAEPI